MADPGPSAQAYTFREAFEGDPEYQKYGPDALAIFALALYMRLEDPSEFAATAITEGPADKKADICYFDESEGRAIVAQSYFSTDWNKPAAPANKASDLSTAVTWLLSASEAQIPPALLPKAQEIRHAIESGALTRIEIVYIHNCRESQNVREELRVVAAGARDIITGMTPQRQEPVVVSYREIGLDEIEDLFRSRESQILVDDVINVPVGEFVREEGQGWTAILASVHADWVRSLYRDHGDRLFSANYRDYIGSSSRQTNINRQITETASTEPANFWVYNNGITALTHKLDLDAMTIRGISIINGAQTSGALGETPEPAAKEAKVLIRIVECASTELIDKIILYNNTQNQIKPADRRSNDVTQLSLAKQFGLYGITYVHRRTSARIRQGAITAAAIAPALCAFHGDPQTAYRSAKDIFNDEATYQRVFRLGLRAEHVFLVRSLSVALDGVKSDLKGRVDANTATLVEKQEDDVLKYSPSKHFILYVLGAVAEQIMGQRVSDLFEWQCVPTVIAPDNASLAKAWAEAIRAVLPLLASIVQRQGTDPYYNVPRSMELTRNAANELSALLASLESALCSQFANLRDRTTI